MPPELKHDFSEAEYRKAMFWLRVNRLPMNALVTLVTWCSMMWIVILLIPELWGRTYFLIWIAHATLGSLVPALPCLLDFRAATTRENALLAILNAAAIVVPQWISLAIAPAVLGWP